MLNNNKTNSPLSLLGQMVTEVGKSIKTIATSRSNPLTGCHAVLDLIFSYRKVITSGIKDLSTQPETVLNFIQQLNQEHKKLLHAVRQQQVYVKPNRLDRRFKHPSWRSPFFAFAHQSYLLTYKAMMELLSKIEGMTEKDKAQCQFAIRCFLEAVAPSNMMLTNPEVLQKIKETHGKSLAQGTLHLLKDINYWHCYVQISKTPMDGFELGKSIAYTPGTVVYQNPLMQLIRYDNAFDKAYQQPILMVSSWFNKYYIFDLREKNSLIHWLVQQGFTVYAISWVNPDKSHRHFGFEDYLLQGVIKALDNIRQQQAQTKVHLFGYCLGGTLVAASAAYLAATQQPWLQSATYAAALIDFSIPGEIAHIVGPNQLPVHRRGMKPYGYLDGRKMATALNLIDGNHYIWPYFVNYLLRGNELSSHDFIYWSQDFTHITETLFEFYMSQLHNSNVLASQQFTIDGHRLDFSKINVPLYIFSAEQDLLSPWQGCYKSALLHKCPIRFIMSQGNHINGFINPPNKTKHGFYASDHLTKNPEDWQANAKWMKGSWWPDWKAWLTEHTGAMSKPTPNSAIIESAPGYYAKQHMAN